MIYFLFLNIVLQIISETESVKDKWKQWNNQHQAKIKKEVSRLERSGITWILSANHVEEQ